MINLTYLTDTMLPKMGSFLDIFFQEIPLYSDDFEKLVFRFLVNALVVFVIVRLLYYPVSKRRDYLFSFFMISIIIFMVCFTLKKFELKTGMALGLFAIFGIIRYRTSTMPVKEMTYLFIVIGVSVINALASKKFSYTEVLFTNGIVILATYFLERIWILNTSARKVILYDKISMIHPSRKEELKSDLEQRTGLKITSVEIGKINFLNDTAQVIIHFNKNQEEGSHFMDEGIESTR
jgi:hypothetical protein